MRITREEIKQEYIIIGEEKANKQREVLCGQGMFSKPKQP